MKTPKPPNPGETPASNQNQGDSRPPLTQASIDWKADDIVVPFVTARKGIVGRAVRLAGTVDGILARHDYPLPVAQVLGEAITLTALLGAALKFQGRLILQTKTDGPLSFLVTNYDTPGNLRGYAGFDAEAVASLADRPGETTMRDLVGSGYLAMTIDPGRDMDRYQGIVPLEGQSLAEAAIGYFRQSEQLPTYIHLAVARVVGRAQSGGADENDRQSVSGESWRAGGLIVQNLPSEGGRAPSPSQEDKDGNLILAGEMDDAWQTTRALAATVEDHELTDPTLGVDQLLYRLFHEEQVRANEPATVREKCSCSADRVERMIRQFSSEQLEEFREDDGAIDVKCEFCNTSYRFDPDSL